MQVRRVRLRVANVPYLEAYHGREAGLVGQVVDAVELTTNDHVAFVDDRDGEASELAEALQHAGAEQSPMRRRIVKEMTDHAGRRFLHGVVTGARA